ncbi:MAG: cation transporter [Bacteroidota bacterium]
MNPNGIDQSQKKSLLKLAFGLGVFTIVYNIIEGMVSTYFGYVDETLTLFGFGVDSFIEALSAIGILNMIVLIRNNAYQTTSNFEKTALRITGYSFYILSVGLVVSAAINFFTASKPHTTLWGIYISLISIAIMLVLAVWKFRIGKKLNSDPIVADAKCSVVCIYMSIVLLLASSIYELTHFAYIDIIGSLGLAFFSLREGKECFEKIKTGKQCACGNDKKCK